jgi:hypothetical protein
VFTHIPRAEKISAKTNAGLTFVKIYVIILKKDTGSGP